ncbi:42944_t:CDS:2, partial [Gigaspora margarita]
MVVDEWHEATYRILKKEVHLSYSKPGREITSMDASRVKAKVTRGEPKQLWHSRNTGRLCRKHRHTLTIAKWILMNGSSITYRIKKSNILGGSEIV